MTVSTYAGKPRIFGKSGERSVVLDDEEKVKQTVEMLATAHNNGEHLHLGVQGLKNVRLAFLRELPFLSRLTVSRCEGSSLADIETCKNLRYLSIRDSEEALDLSALPLLQTLVVGEWNNCIHGLGSLKQLIRLDIHKMRRKKLDALTFSPNLRELRIVETTLESLQGIERLAGLISLVVAYAPKITSLAGIERLASLRRLRLDRLKNLSNYGPVVACKRLMEVEVSHCALLPSLDWVAALQELRLFTLIGTDVADGDLHGLIQHENLLWVGVTSKRHFCPSARDVVNQARDRRLAMGFDSRADAVKRGQLPKGMAASDDAWAQVA